MARLAAVLLLALIGCVARTALLAVADDGGSPPPLAPTLTLSVPSSPPPQPMAEPAVVPSYLSPPPTPIPAVPSTPPPPPTSTIVMPSSPPPPTPIEPSSPPPPPTPATFIPSSPPPPPTPATVVLPSSPPPPTPDPAVVPSFPPPPPPPTPDPPVVPSSPPPPPTPTMVIPSSPSPPTPVEPSPPPPTPVEPPLPPPTPVEPPPLPLTPVEPPPPPPTPIEPPPPPPTPVEPPSPPPTTVIPISPPPTAPTPVVPSSPPPPVPIPIVPSSPPPPAPTPQPPPASGGFTVGYYSKTCSGAESIVRDVVRGAMYADRSIGAGLIRLFFHDCFVQGCDASVLLDPTPANPQPEKLGIPNMRSLRGFEVIDAAKAAVERECSGVVSCADIVAFAGRDATLLLSNGKINFEMPAGRYDGLVSLAGETTPNLPPPFADVQQLKTMFAAKGLTTDEMVTLSGAHSVGRYHCSSFANRLPPYTSDMNPTLSRSLQGQCSSLDGTDNTVAQDIVTPDDLDNQYYRNVMYSKALLKSDAALMTSPETAAAVTANSFMSWKWESKFKAAMVRMGSIEIKNSANGEIRKNCRLVNY